MAEKTGQKAKGAGQAAEAMHTPGPWQVDIDDDETLVCIREGDPICQMCDMVEQTEANAKLISLSPRMYTAIKEFVKAYAGNKRSQLGNGFAFHWYALAEDIVSEIEGD